MSYQLIKTSEYDGLKRTCETLTYTYGRKLLVKLLQIIWVFVFRLFKYK